MGGDPFTYNFESATQGWTYSGSEIASITTTNSIAFRGSRSLMVNFTSAGSESTSQVSVIGMLRPRWTILTSPPTTI